MGPPGPITEIGRLGPHDRLVIHLKDIRPEVLKALDAELVKIGLANQAIIFSGDVVDSLTIVAPEPLDTDTIVDGSRTIIEEMKDYDGSSGTPRAS